MLLHQFGHFYHLPTKLRETNVFTGVCHSVHGERDMSNGREYPPTSQMWHLISTPPPSPFITEDLLKLVQHDRTTYPPPPPLILTPSGAHQNTYCWQVGSTHHTGMLSCWLKFPVFSIREFSR